MTLVDEKVCNEPNGNTNFGYMNGAGGRANINEKQMSWVDGIFNCMKPVLSLIGKNNIHEARMRNVDDWEIPFEIISGEKSFLSIFGAWANENVCVFPIFADIEWLGSGAQGAVFSGKLYNEIVAVKKVKDVRETDIRHLRKLNHENIVKFK